MVVYSVLMKVAIGAKVMLNTNVDITNGLVNSAGGEVVRVVSDNDNALTHILAKFDHPNVRIKVKLFSLHSSENSTHWLFFEMT